MKLRRMIVLGVAVCVIVSAVIVYSSVTNIVAVGTIPNSALFNGPATVTVRQLIIAPGETLPWHYHPGYVYNVVKRGTLTLQDGCGHLETLKAGDSFEETEFHVHRAMNLGTDEVEVYNTFIIYGQNPTTMNMPNNEPHCGSLVPVLTLSASKFCPGGSWTLSATNGVANTTANLIMTANGNSSKASNWSKTDGTGNLSVTGVFDSGAAGDYTLRADIGGLLSNTISFTVSNCTRS